MGSLDGVGEHAEGGCHEAEHDTRHCHLGDQRPRDVDVGERGDGEVGDADGDDHGVTDERRHDRRHQHDPPRPAHALHLEGEHHGREGHPERSSEATGERRHEQDAPVDVGEAGEA